MESMLNKVKEAVVGGNAENEQTGAGAAPRQENTFGTEQQTTTALGHENNSGSSYDGDRHAQSTTQRTGPAHDDETLNKLDPRVSESRTSAATTTTSSINPLDAAQAPPSVLKEHVDGPHIHHDHPQDSTTKRHSVSHQEAHLMR